MTKRLKCTRCGMAFRIVERQHDKSDPLRCEDCLLPYQCRDVEPPRRCLLTVRRADYERWAGVMPLQSWRDVETAGGGGIAGTKRDPKEAMVRVVEMPR